MGIDPSVPFYVLGGGYNAAVVNRLLVQGHKQMTVPASWQ
jgi:hypothetical protein